MYAWRTHALGIFISCTQSASSNSIYLSDPPYHRLLFSLLLTQQLSMACVEQPFVQGAVMHDVDEGIIHYGHLSATGPDCYAATVASVIVMMSWWNEGRAGHARSVAGFDA